MSEKISVVVPVYQSEQYIEACIESIIKQTYVNFELIIVNDGTKDRSIEIALKLLSNTNIDYQLINKENGGLSSARNAGIRNSTGELIVFVDSDDILDMSFLEKLSEGFIDSSILLSCCDISPVPISQVSEIKGKILKKTEILSRDEILNDFLLRRRIIHPCTIMVRKEIFENKDFFFNESILYSEDQYFIWKCLFFSKKTAYTHSKLYNYVQRDNSIMTSSKIDKIITGFNAVEVLESDLKENYPEFKKLINLVAGRWTFGLLRSSARLVNKSDFQKLFALSKTRKYLSYLKEYKDIRIRLLAKFITMNPRLGYLLLKRI